MLYKALMLCNSHLNQLYLSKKMVRFSYKDGSGVRGHTRIEAIKRRVDLGYKQLQVISNIMLFKTIIPLRN